MSFEQAAAALDPSPPSAAAPASARKRLMLELAITFSGRQYQYAQYRYDRLEDAAAYARLQLVSPSAGDAADPPPPAQSVEAPDELERRRMATHGIRFADGVYRLGPYRYDRLADALRYARLKRPEPIYFCPAP
jgi:hypothetical protein